MTRFFRSPSAHAAPAAAPTDAQHRLRRRLVLTAGTAAVVALAALVGGGLRLADHILSDRATARLRETAARGALLVQRTLLERQREIELIGAAPSVIDAAREGAARAAALGLVGLPSAELERRFGSARTLGVGERAQRFLADRLVPLGLIRVVITDRHGFSAVAAGRGASLIQRDHAWWRRAMEEGLAPAEVEYDEGAGDVVVRMAAALREGARGRAEGALEVVFPARTLGDALANASIDGLVLDIVDASGRVIASSGGASRLQTFAGAEGLLGLGSGAVARFEAEGVRQIAAVAPGNAGGWQIIAHTADARIVAPLGAVRPYIIAAVGVLVLLVLLGLWLMSRFVEQRISAPVTELAAVAEAVAARDLSVRVSASEANDEIGRLSRATARMTDDLRHLVFALRDAAAETAARASQITASGDQLAGSAQQVAATSSELSQQATEMAGTIQGMTVDAARLAEIATELARGASAGVERNATLRTLAQENAARLEAGTGALERLAEDARASADAIAMVATASEEFQLFVAFVRKMAKQSKLLALNAAMEAARAGAQGRGFAVVAGEVRRLAANAAEAADRTETLVTDVVQRIEQSYDRSARTVQTVDEVLRTTRLGRESFSAVARAADDAEQWTGAIDRAAGTASELVAHLGTRVEALAFGTESYAAAMQQVAASSEEQSASTEEIAAAAKGLADAAARLATLIATFRLDGADAPRVPDESRVAPRSAVVA